MPRIPFNASTLRRNDGELFTAEIAEDAEMNVNERAFAGSSMIFLMTSAISAFSAVNASHRRYETQY